MNKINYFEMTPIEVYSLVVKGKIKKFPNNYLDKEIVKEIVRHVILNIYGYDRQQVINKVNHEFMQKNFLGGVRKLFEYSDAEVLAYSFPEWDLKYWEFKKVSPNFWHKRENLKDFLLWVCNKEGLNSQKKEDLRKITAKVLEKYGGSKPLVHAGGMYELLSIVTDGKYKKWEIMKMVSWSTEEITCAMKWLVEEQLHYTPEQTCNLKVADFVKYNLDGMLQKECNHSILKALEIAYPGMYCRTKARGIVLKK